jgi:molybdopterin converting factor small subunit
LDRRALLRTRPSPLRNRRRGEVYESTPDASANQSEGAASRCWGDRRSGSTVSALSGHLADVYPQLAPAAMLAVDDSSEMLPLDKVLTDGQSVELIGSMAGG